MPDYNSRAPAMRQVPVTGRRLAYREVGRTNGRVGSAFHLKRRSLRRSETAIEVERSRSLQAECRPLAAGGD